jgi:hypothetical protein
MSLWVFLSPEPRPALPQLREQFDPALTVVDSLDEAELYVRAGLKPHSPDAETADAIEQFVARRFAHDLGVIRRQNDWVAWSAGIVIWKNLAFTTRPDDMLKSRRGLCSQQAMLMQALLARFGIEYATVGISAPAHMMVGAKINGKWAVYDPDVEPLRTRTIWYSEMSDPVVMHQLYRSKPGNPAFGQGEDLGEQMARAARDGHLELKWINQNPAPRAFVFHQVTSMISRLGWAFFAIAGLLVMASRRIGGLNLAFPRLRFRRSRFGRMAPGQARVWRPLSEAELLERIATSSDPWFRVPDQAPAEVRASPRLTMERSSWH